MHRVHLFASVFATVFTACAAAKNETKVIKLRDDERNRNLATLQALFVEQEDPGGGTDKPATASADQLAANACSAAGQRAADGAAPVTPTRAPSAS